eukprot:GHVN01024471.1.p3 GENE.GHVN01024471.1~~GHVN01024471.1.p3  ORF type:complete len:105 (+),score=12.19 GHVN01024471.1:98-412(+)
MEAASRCGGSKNSVSLKFFSVLTVLLGSTAVVNSWRIKSLEEDQFAPVFDIKLCPYFDGYRRWCTYVVGAVFDRENCDCSDLSLSSWNNQVVSLFINYDCITTI